MSATSGETPLIDIVEHRDALKQAVIDLILSIQRDEFGFDVQASDQPDLSEVADFYQRGDGGFWVAVDGDAVVGTIALRDIGNGQGALRKMFVRASHRGHEHQVALRLLAHLITFASGRGVREILLGTTERFLAAHRFYEKHGFTRIDPDTLPDAFPRMALDTRFYRRTLA